MAYWGRIKFTTATTGTGAITVGSAVSGYQTPASASVANASALQYVIEDGAAWEAGTGTYTSAGTTLSRTLIASSTGALLSLSGSATCMVTRPSGPKVTQYTSGSGTHTTATGCTRMRVRAVGGGAGGGGSGTTAGAGTAGGATTFGTSLLTANGAAANASSTTHGAAGTATGGDINITGQVGSDAMPGYTNAQGGTGGSTPLGMGQTSLGQSTAVAGAGYGSGGSGAGSSGTASPGSGGSAGGYLEKWINAPAATYAYAVGAGGTAGAAGTSGAAGAAGAAGTIIVEEFFD